MIFRPSREHQNDRWFELRAALFVIGASLGIAGMVSARGWLVWIAIAIIAVGVAFRFVPSTHNDNNKDA